jgi:hypothetical protein
MAGLSEIGDKNVPWQQGALAFDRDGPNFHPVVALSDKITHYRQSSSADAYWARFRDMVCDRIGPVVAEHLGPEIRVDILAWDGELMLPERPYGLRSALLATLPRDCARGGRFGRP